MIERTTEKKILTVGELEADAVGNLAARYQVAVEWIADSKPIFASFWGEPEAGVIGQSIFLRSDTPVHSLLHELCHIICMPADRRRSLHRDAGGDDIEESAVCYLQIVLADYLPGVDSTRLMRDMDAWGYSFRLGSTQRWFSDDAADAQRWLRAKKLLDATGSPLFRLRET